MSAPPRRGIGVPLRCRVALSALSGLGAAALVLAGCHSAAAPAQASVADTYGGLPTFLPSISNQADGVLTGTKDNPAITSQGDTVDVRLPHGAVLATVTGPEVPGEGLPVETPTTTCTWTVTLRHASQAIPITTGEFTAIDHLGHVYPMALVAGQPAPPTRLLPGRAVSFELRAIMPTGEGLMRYAPDNLRTVASWDFEVETD